MEISKKHETRIVTEYRFVTTDQHFVSEVIGPDDTINEDFVEGGVHYVFITKKKPDGMYRSLKVPHDQIVYREGEQLLEEVPPHDV